METSGLPKPDNVIFGEIQVLLAEKRTALAGLRTGIAVFALPLSVLSALIATSRYYSIEKVMPLLAAADAAESGSRRARHLAGFPFDTSHSSFRAPYSRPQREIPLSRAVLRVAQPTRLRLQKTCTLIHHKPLTMRPSTFKIFGERAAVRVGLALHPQNPMSEVSDQLPAAALARARSSQAARKAFISARSITIRLATPLYFFVIPVTVRVTAPEWTRP